ncbi:MAG: ferritin-like domain-containing protein [Streptomycetales bacterium]
MKQPLTEVAALQSALEAEHAAVYGYGIAGARLRGERATLARSAYESHRTRRDQLVRMVRERDATPAASAVAYDLPFPVRSADEAVDLAVWLEEGVAAAYADVVQAAARDLRMFAAQGLREVAVRAVRWRGRSVAWPGLPERSAGPERKPRS